MSLPNIFFANPHSQLKNVTQTAMTSASSPDTDLDCDDNLPPCDVFFADESDSDNASQPESESLTLLSVEHDLTAEILGNGGKRSKKKRARERSPQTTMRLKRVRRSKANDRERNRMHGLNAALDRLRNVIPKQNDDSKMTKIDTLRNACAYILTLQTFLQKDTKDYDPVFEAKTLRFVRQMPVEQQQLIIGRIANIARLKNFPSLVTANCSLIAILHHAKSGVSSNFPVTPYCTPHDAQYSHDFPTSYFECDNSSLQQVATSLFDESTLNMDSAEIDPYQTSFFPHGGESGVPMQMQTNCTYMGVRGDAVEPQCTSPASNCNNNNQNPTEILLPPVSCISGSLQARGNYCTPTSLSHSNGSSIQCNQISPLSPSFAEDFGFPHFATGNNQMFWQNPSTPSDSVSLASTSSPYNSPHKQITTPDVGAIQQMPMQMMC